MQPRVFGVYHDATLCECCQGDGHVIAEDVCCGDPGCSCMGQDLRTITPCRACEGEG